MADSDQQGSTQNASQNQQQQPQQNTVLGHMMNNKVEAGLWMTRIFTVISSILFLLPFFGGNPFTHYQRALISNAATSALRLHQRIPDFQFSRAFFAVLFAEDSCHYLLFSIIFLNSYPITMVLVPIFLFALLHACNYTKTLINIMGNNSMQLVQNMILKLQAQQVGILRFIACTEIFLMPALIFMTLSVCPVGVFFSKALHRLILVLIETRKDTDSGKSTIFHPFVYYRFLSLRYASRRNPYCRTLFYELRMTVEYVCTKPSCPQFVRNICIKGIALISRLAPQVNQ